MNLLMQIDHMQLIYFTAVLLLVLVSLAVVFVNMNKQIRETRRLSAKLDRMINEVLSIGDQSDYSVRSKTFK